MKNLLLKNLSLGGQFATATAFCSALAPVLRLRQRSELVRRMLYTSNVLYARPVVGDLTFWQAVHDGSQKDFRQLILQWITKQGPFVDDDRQQVDDDLFFFAGQDVTDQGLGEAARRRCVGQQAGSFSFLGGPVDCGGSPLTVQHGIEGYPIGYIDITTVCEAGLLERALLEGLPPPKSWTEVLDHCRDKYDRLLISGEIISQLRREPFFPYVCERASALLSVLQEYMTARLPNGERSARCHEIVQTHFTGDKAWFSDEADHNKIIFREEMTFIDPSDQLVTIFCPWHGKIKTPQYRIHFEWPVSTGANRVKVVYIGPKITKR